MHDDVHFLDFFTLRRIAEGLEIFDVLGVAGNKRRLPSQPSWAFINTELAWDTSEHLSGVVAHGKTFPPRQVTRYGDPRQAVKLLDGLFIAAKSDILFDSKTAFDERFDFHFYDLDFCRQAEKNGLTCGTWDLSLMHESGGFFGGDNWKNNYKRYIEKWGE